MGGQVKRPPELGAAVSAPVESFSLSVVCAQMLLQRTSPDTQLPTNRAPGTALGGGGGAAVSLLVQEEGTLLAETLGADGALERLVSGVGVAVVTQVVLPPEPLVADVALEGPLVRVGPLVDQQVVALGEVPATVPADELLPAPPPPHPPRSLRWTCQPLVVGVVVPEALAGAAVT